MASYSDGDASDAATDAVLLHILDHARQLNLAIDIARLERMRFIYRSWVASAASVEGGFSLTRDELDCVLEYPPRQCGHLNFLMATFRTTNDPSDKEERMDLLTLLAACTCLARGPLEAKGTFLFSLVDLDTEDEIVEDELAMVVALCSDGLRRLGVIVTELDDLDARAIACEAFEFVEVDGGGKMSLALFVQWLVSHWRPAALFDRIQSLLLISRVAQRLHDALQQRTQEGKSSPFHIYNAAHFNADPDAEKTKVVVGPIVGPISSSEVRILLEVNCTTTVRFFAFRVNSTSRSPLRGQNRQYTVAFDAWVPQAVVMDGLAPGENYQIRLLGVCTRDRERCVAFATTRRPHAMDVQGGNALWELHAINHDGMGPRAHAYQRLRQHKLKAAEAKVVLMTVHFSAIYLDGLLLKRMIELLHEDFDANKEMVCMLVRQSFRDCLNRSELFACLRIGSNLLFGSRREMMGMNQSTIDSTSMIDSSHVSDFVGLVLHPWRMYIGKLWGIKTDDAIAAINDGSTCIVLNYDAKQSSEHLAEILPTLASARDLVVVATEPILPPFSDVNDSVADDTARAAALLEKMMYLADWKLGSLNRNVCIVARHPVAGFQSRFAVKNTTISITQALCGPSAGCSRYDDLSTEAHSTDLREAVISTEAPITAPHCVIVRRVVGESSSRPTSRVESSRPISRNTHRSPRGNVDIQPTRVTSEICVLEDEVGVRVLCGPIVGMASERNAVLKVECARDGVIQVRLSDQLTNETCTTRLHVQRDRPVACIVSGLRSGRIYRVSLAGVQNSVDGVVQTAHGDPASVRMLVLADDAFCDQPVAVRRDRARGSVTSHMGNIRRHLIDGEGHSGAPVMYDMTIHVGSIAALRNDLLRGHEMLRVDRTGSCHEWTRLEDMVRACYRSYTAIPDVRTLRSRGPNWFSGIGIVRSLVQKEAPVRLLQAVVKVLHEYEDSDVTLDRHASGLVHKLANGIFVITLDTTDFLFGAANTEFIEWPENLLTTRQHSALCHVLQAAQQPSASSKQVLVFCDAPFVWPFTIDTAPRNKAGFDKTLEIARDPWAAYGQDLCRLLDLLVDAMIKNPTLRITLVCSGKFASRVIISHKPSGRSIEQLSLGTISNIDYRQPSVARYTPESMQSSLSKDYSLLAHAVGGTSLSLRQYCILNVVPHSRGAVLNHSFYTAGRPEASLVLGPVIGRVTTRTARILIEVDRRVETVTCVLSAARSGHSVSAECELLAFTPTIIKLEGLHPDSRYKVKFEGLMAGQDDIDAYVETPALMPLSVEWLVFSRNNLRHFLPARESGHDNSASHWHSILSPGARSYNTQPASIVATRNGDSLGDSLHQQSEQFNPWYHVEAFALSEPLRQTQLSIHIGGQVNLRTAMADDELGTLFAQLCDASINQEVKNELYASIRFRLQEVYRTTWAVEPMRTILGRSSNVMLLHDQTDLFFSSSRMQELIQQRDLVDGANNIPTDDQVSHVADRLRAMAFELWQLYQNQLSVDVNESDLDNSRRNSSKFGSHVTLGMCRLVFVNVSDELRDLYSGFPSAVEEEKVHSRTTQATQQIVPLTLSSANDGTQLALLSSATWKIVDEALDIDPTNAGSGAQKGGTRKKTAHGNVSVKQLVVVLPIDLIEMVTALPAVRLEVIRLLEKLFHWKVAARAERNASLICASEGASSLSFTIMDEKVNESLTMTRISSISKLTDGPTTKSAPTRTKQASKTTAATIKGYFSKRFTYQSTPIATSAVAATATKGTHCRSYANYLFLSDYRRGFLNESLRYFPSQALPKIVLGPVIGRMVRTEHEMPTRQDASDDLIQVVSFSAPILVEINSPARVTCVVVDSMINSEMRVIRELPADQPTVICISGLVPLRRYVYFFEGVSNGDARRGCFHTPPSESSSLHIVAVSTNFPTQMDEEQDSLWVPLLERAKLPWCGLDAILHLGGQVPLHEAAIECFEWAHREIGREILHGDPKEVEAKRVRHVRTQVRRRFQQEYRICWNLPNIRELFACASHWFLYSKADIAPFYGREHPGSVDASLVFALVLEVAQEVVRAYQLQLMAANINEQDRVESVCPPATAAPTEEETKPVEPTSSSSSNVLAPPSPISSVSEPSAIPVKDAVSEQTETVKENLDSAADEILDSGGALYWQHDDIAIFMSDMRSTSAHESSESDLSEPITCNGRLSRPLSLQENPMMSETQWRYFERVLRKKRTLLLVLCMELPFILTNAVHVEKLREDLRTSPAPQVGHWKLYDHNHVLQHWVACKRQLEQLLLLLFKWKAKRSGRDVLILSGGMRIGIDTLLQDRETKLSIRNLTVGPVTAHVETFEFPLSGVACATFGGGTKDDHFTFHHGLLAKKNYVLLRVAIDHQQQPSPIDKGTESKQADQIKTASVVADFVPNEPAVLARLHPVDKFRRFPLWWTTYVPMGKSVFWDDTITLKSETDERMLALREYVWHDRGFSGALEVFYEKYQFAETARMEDLRSRRSQHVDLQANFLSVLTELWRAIPESKRQQMAYFLDPFVREMLLTHVEPDLVTTRLASGEPIELAFFSRVLREFVFEACLLRLTIVTQQEDEVRAHHEKLEKRKRNAERDALEQEQKELAAQQEAARMAELLRTDPLQYATIKLAQKETEKREKLARRQEKLDRKKAARLAELDEEQAIAKEQKKLNKLAERSDAAHEYERRQRELDARIRKLEETRAQRAAQKKAAAEKAAKETLLPNL